MPAIKLFSKDKELRNDMAKILPSIIKYDRKQENYSIEILFSHDLILKRVREIASCITRDYKNKNTLIIAVLKGSFVFCADLIRHLDFIFAFDFISLSSYKGLSAKGKVKVISDIKEELEGKDVIIIEDIADTGHTLDFLHKELAAKNPRSVKTCVFLDKKCSRVKNVPIDYYGFEIGNDFVVGYGLDYNGFFRGLPYIGILNLNKSNK
ncbi:MAG: hypoxanthine phosphoribosyltransferase [Endomicrobium sp.]|jgi:hypoxanthine phosphoribosyltransferase|nr:hypoxanthine phosphoribosyltransferase [Endomicrobium sp.]